MRNRPGCQRHTSGRAGERGRGAGSAAQGWDQPGHRHPDIPHPGIPASRTAALRTLAPLCPRSPAPPGTPLPPPHHHAPAPHTPDRVRASPALLFALPLTPALRSAPPHSCQDPVPGSPGPPVPVLPAGTGSVRSPHSSLLRPGTRRQRTREGGQGSPSPSPPDRGQQSHRGREGCRASSHPIPPQPGLLMPHTMLSPSYTGQGLSAQDLPGLWDGGEQGSTRVQNSPTQLLWPSSLIITKTSQVGHCPRHRHAHGAPCSSTLMSGGDGGAGGFPDNLFAWI